MRISCVVLVGLVVIRRNWLLSFVAVVARRFVGDCVVFCVYVGFCPR